MSIIIVFVFVVILASASFFTPAVSGDFHWNLSDNKIQEISRMRFSIKAVFCNSMVSSLLSVFSSLLETLPRTSIRIAITVTYSVFKSQRKKSLNISSKLVSRTYEV